MSSPRDLRRLEWKNLRKRQPRQRSMRTPEKKDYGPLPLQACYTGKKAFDNERQAAEFGRGERQQRQKPYHCPECGNWHNTTVLAQPSIPSEVEQWPEDDIGRASGFRS